MKIVDIIDAWGKASNPSEEELELAKHRAEICENCPFKKEINSFFLKKLIDEEALMAKYVCSLCGCPLSKKVFVSENSDKGKCPDNRWLK